MNLHFRHKAVPCLQYDFSDPCSILVSTGTAVLGVLYLLCRFKDVTAVSYFVTAIGLVLALIVITLHNREMEYLVQFALYLVLLGFHIEDA